MNPRYNHFNNNRGFGGPIVPFVLGGIVGSIWSNNNNRYYPYPVYPMPYYPYQYYPYNRFY